MAGFQKTVVLLAMLLSTIVTGLIVPSLNVSYYNHSIAGPPIKAPTATRYSWWIDQSCKNTQGFEASFNEAREMACVTKTKLASKTDRDFERVFEYTFHASKSSGWTYPHSDAWKKRNRKNTKRTPLQHSNYRATIDLCDLAFPKTQVAKLIDTMDPYDLQDADIDDVGYLTSVTILHEWTHAYPYLTRDVPNRDWLGRPIPNSAYGWIANGDKTTADALLNAETYTLMALWAKLSQVEHEDLEGSSHVMRGGFTLARDPGDDFPVARTVANQQALEGRLMAYADITH
ncbi:hypothetical protein SLS62_005547 [Diatrype stigma]|uniref:Uncharacterized protein n=1 Tax=Diatrype stigma TaxID=117547 RepID=A0AAN9V0H9_9PEZI